jgi:hypothetical protein
MGRCVAANIHRVVRSLINPDVVNEHFRGELEVLEILSLETGRHAKIHNYSLRPISI